MCLIAALLPMMNIVRFAVCFITVSIQFLYSENTDEKKLAEKATLWLLSTIGGANTSLKTCVSLSEESRPHSVGDSYDYQPCCPLSLGTVGR